MTWSRFLDNRREADEVDALIAESRDVAATEGSAKDAENSMAELAALAETAGSTVLDALIQRRDKPDPATFIGSGKVNELKAIVKSTGADTVVCDGELSPSQLRNLEDRVKVKVVDRTVLILDIFASRSNSSDSRHLCPTCQEQRG